MCVSDTFAQDTVIMMAMSSVCFTIFCLHGCMCLTTRFLPSCCDSGTAFVKPRVMVSAFSLHAAVHILFQTSMAYANVVSHNVR